MWVYQRTGVLRKVGKALPLWLQYLRTFEYLKGKVSMGKTRALAGEQCAKERKESSFLLVVAAIFGRGGWSTAIADRLKSFDNR